MFPSRPDPAVTATAREDTSFTKDHHWSQGLRIHTEKSLVGTLEHMKSDSNPSLLLHVAVNAELWSTFDTWTE